MTIQDRLRQDCSPTCRCLTCEAADYIDKLELENERLKDRRFRIMGGSSIPWRMIAPHETQALANHDQTLEQLHGRGGLSPKEAVAVLEGKPYRTVRAMSESDGQRRLTELLHAFEALEAWNSNAPLSEDDLRRIERARNKVLGEVGSAEKALPDEVMVDGIKSDDGLIEYWGRATKLPNGKYRCYANVCGVVGLVEVTITPEKKE